MKQYCLRVGQRTNYVNELDDLTQSSETVSDDGDVLYSMNSTLHRTSQRGV